LISEKNGRDHRSLFGEDLTAVRDELAALTASAAGEAHRLNLGCCRSAKSFLPAGSSKLATMRGWRYRRATADRPAAIRRRRGFSFRAVKFA
jgi:hypothetical protein